MIDAGKLLGTLVSSQMGGKKKKGKNPLGGMLNTKTMLVGLGAVGAAYLAHKHFVADKPGTPPPQPPPPLPPPPINQSAVSSRGAALPPALPPAVQSAPQLPPPPPTAAPAAREDTTLFLLRAMVAAASADHEIDAEERRRIAAKAELFALGPAERSLLDAELDRPLSLHQVVDEARRGGHPARQVYAASFLTITADTEAERAYLRRLAEGLGMTPAEAEELEGLLSG